MAACLDKVAEVLHVKTCRPAQPTAEYRLRSGDASNHSARYTEAQCRIVRQHFDDTKHIAEFDVIPALQVTDINIDAQCLFASKWKTPVKLGCVSARLVQ